MRDRICHKVLANLFFLLATNLVFASCVLQDYHPIPQNYSSSTTQSINQTPVLNQTNTTNQTVEPPKPILLPVGDKLAVYILDTDKKGSSIITLNKHSLLINAQGGSDGLRILKTLRNVGVNQLDFLIVTNGEENNIAGITPIILRMPPKKLIHSGIPSLSSSYNLYTSLYKNITLVPHDDLFVFDESVVKLFVPYDDGISITDDSSIVIKLIYGDITILFVTDCGVDCESRLSNQDINNNLKSNILISNGGCNSLAFSFLQEINPELVIFSGQPCKETSDRVASIDIPYLTTYDNGDIVITTDGVKYEYKKLKSR